MVGPHEPEAAALQSRLSASTRAWTTECRRARSRAADDRRAVDEATTRRRRSCRAPPAPPGSAPALVMVDSIFPRWRTIDASTSSRSTSSSVNAATRRVETHERGAVALALVEDGAPAESRLRALEREQLEELARRRASARPTRRRGRRPSAVRSPPTRTASHARVAVTGRDCRKQSPAACVRSRCMAVASPEPAEPGIWPDAWLLKAVESGLIDAPHFAEEQLQPASVDLTLGDVAYRLRCCFLPGKNDTIEKSCARSSSGRRSPWRTAPSSSATGRTSSRSASGWTSRRWCGRARTRRARPAGSTSSPA